MTASGQHPASKGTLQGTPLGSVLFGALRWHLSCKTFGVILHVDRDLLRSHRRIARTVCNVTTHQAKVWSCSPSPHPLLSFRASNDKTADAAQINDRYEFPDELDLDLEGGKWLSENADRSVRNLYKLHSVLVHSGGVHGGHYYAYIQPDRKRWLKFDDERVGCLEPSVCLG